MMKIASAEFIKSATEPSHYPEGNLPEVAFVGRSNVGKSSLINVLVQRKKLARTSQTPGCTQNINFFTINNLYSFVDLPGYGFARAPLSVRKKWGPMVEMYLRERETLRLAIFILDIRRDPAIEDIDLINWFCFYNIPFAFVLTKIDKLSRSQVAVRKRTIEKLIKMNPCPEMIHFSAKTGEGREQIWKAIKEILT
jgi:GTP-binding protein